LTSCDHNYNYVLDELSLSIRRNTDDQNIVRRVTVARTRVAGPNPCPFPLVSPTTVSKDLGDGSPEVGGIKIQQKSRTKSGTPVVPRATDRPDECLLLTLVLYPQPSWWGELPGEQNVAKRPVTIEGCSLRLLPVTGKVGVRSGISVCLLLDPHQALCKSSTIHPSTHSASLRLLTTASPLSVHKSGSSLFLRLGGSSATSTTVLVTSSSWIRPLSAQGVHLRPHRVVSCR
jgi:hypothetical protein